MAYAKQYNVGEIKGLLSIVEGSKNGVINGNQPAHSVSKHSKQTQGDMTVRSKGKRGPSNVSTYKDFDTLVLATVEALNSVNGQAALQLLDNGHDDAVFNAPLAGGYFASKVYRVGGRATGTITNEPFMLATEAFVKICRWINGKLWIQTSFPSKLNARPAPSLADYL